jgi:hypothetical protein
VQSPQYLSSLDDPGAVDYGLITSLLEQIAAPPLTGGRGGSPAVPEQWAVWRHNLGCRPAPRQLEERNQRDDASGEEEEEEEEGGEDEEGQQSEAEDYGDDEEEEGEEEEEEEQEWEYPWERDEEEDEADAWQRAEPSSPPLLQQLQRVQQPQEWERQREQQGQERDAYDAWVEEWGRRYGDSTAEEDMPPRFADSPASAAAMARWAAAGAKRARSGWVETPGGAQVASRTAPGLAPGQTAVAGYPQVAKRVRVGISMAEE